VARSLSGTTRPDGLYRYGGEEFALLASVTSDISAIDIAERIRRAVEGLELPNAGNPPHGRLTISVGVFTIGARELALGDEVWFGRADEALYRAKAAGRTAQWSGTRRARERPIWSLSRPPAGPSRSPRNTPRSAAVDRIVLHSYYRQ